MGHQCHDLRRYHHAVSDSLRGERGEAGGGVEFAVKNQFGGIVHPRDEHQHRPVENQ